MSNYQRLTKPELMQILRDTMSGRATKEAKQELATVRSNMASWFYHNSEPINDTKPRHVLD